MKCRNPFEPNTVNSSPSSKRAIKLTIFIVEVPPRKIESSAPTCDRSHERRRAPLGSADGAADILDTAFQRRRAGTARGPGPSKGNEPDRRPTTLDLAGRQL